MTVAQRTLPGTGEGSCQVVAPYSGKEFLVTFVCDTSIFASGDLVSDVVEIPSLAEQAGGSRVLRSLTLLDKSDNTASAYTLVFAQTSTSMGTVNGAPNMSDANLLLARPRYVPVASGDWFDIGGAKIATIRNIELPLQCAAGATSMWVSVVNGAGTPTMAAAGDLVMWMAAA